MTLALFGQLYLLGALCQLIGGEVCQWLIDALNTPHRRQCDACDKDGPVWRRGFGRAILGSLVNVILWPLAMALSWAETIREFRAWRVERRVEKLRARMEGE